MNVSGWSSILTQVGAMVAALLGSAGLWRVIAKVIHGTNAVEAAIYKPALDELKQLRVELAAARAEADKRVDEIRLRLGTEQRRCDKLEIQLRVITDRLTRAEAELAALRGDRK